MGLRPPSSRPHLCSSARRTDLADSSLSTLPLAAKISTICARAAPSSHCMSGRKRGWARPGWWPVCAGVARPNVALQQRTGVERALLRRLGRSGHDKSRLSR
eukprot:5502875-Prymnesium_polylepis.1